MGITDNKIILKRLQENQVISPVYDLKIGNIQFFQDIIHKNSLGSLRYLNAQNATIDYSRFVAIIQVNKDNLGLRRVISLQLAYNIFIFSVIVLLLIIFFEKKVKCSDKVTWFLQTILLFFILFSTEVILIDQLVNENSSTNKLKIIVMTFDILWWLTPALLLSLLIKRFVWIPLEARTERKIPNVIRLFVAAIIYLLACFGIIAFVYDQPITSLLATSGVVAMIIGLAIQVNISNVFSGIVINLERPFRIKDWVKIQIGKVITEGQVVDITWRTTRILSGDGYVLSIPNSVASEAIVHNYNYPNELCKSSFSLHIDYSHFPNKVEKILLDAVLSTQGVLSKPKSSANFKGFTDWAASY